MTETIVAPAVAEETFGVGTMNIPAAAGQGGDLPPSVVARVAAAAEAQVGLLATQETIEPEDNTALDKALPPARWRHFVAASENDLFAKIARWTPTPADRLPSGVNSTGRRHLSKGEAHISPARDLTHVVLDWVEQPDWDPFVFCGTHLIVVKKDGALGFREDARAEEMDGLQENFTYWETRGLNVLLCLDSNWGKMPKPLPHWVWDVQAGHGGIDKIGHLNAAKSNWTLNFVSHETYANASDHDFQVANMLARGKAPAPPAPKTIAQQVDDFLLTVATGRVSSLADADRATLRGIVAKV